MKQFAVAFNILYIPKMSDLVTKSFPCPFELFRLFVLCVTRHKQIPGQVHASLPSPFARRCLLWLCAASRSQSKCQVAIIQTVWYLQTHGWLSAKWRPRGPGNTGAFVILPRRGLFSKHSEGQAGRNA